MEELKRVELDPRWQVEAYSQVESDFKAGRRSCVVAPTGCGKTAIGLKAIEDNPGKSILWLTSSSTGIGETKKLIKEIYGKEAKEIFPRLKFLTYNALSRMTDADYKNLNPDLIIYDEIHRAGAEIWGIRAQGIAEKTKGNVLGLTATPVRTDGQNMAGKICRRSVI
ncbi:MAG: DEAD/DEAH box helicase family protein [Oscillospiraceae bacterium]|nr:DEAD/DEAH box helicase family protein [Oscillospiraceae bacterium]